MTFNTWRTRLSLSTGSGLTAYLPLIVMLLGMPAAVWVTLHFYFNPDMQRSARAATSAPPKEVKAPVPLVLHDSTEEGVEALDAERTKITVNVERRYVNLRVSILGEHTEGQAAFRREIRRKSHLLHDAVVTLLSSKTLREINERDFRETFRVELEAQFNRILAPSVVERVLIPEFLISQ